MTIQNERQMALSILLEMQNQGAYSNLVLQQRLPKRGPLSSKNGFVTALVYGVVERRITLDAIIDSYTNKKLDMEVRTILQMGLYQIAFMERVTDNTAVNETVKLCYAVKKVSAKGMVNAILRRFLRDGKKLPSATDEVAQWSITYSCPTWLIEKWRREYGVATAQKLLAASLEAPPLYVRVNTEKTTVEELITLLEERKVTVKDTVLTGALALSDTGSIEKLKPFREGKFYVQDLASQICVLLTGAKSGDVVYDLCAAPGSKTFTLAQQMQNSGKIVAFDLYEHKIQLIAQTAERLGLDIVDAQLGDATIYNPKLPLADVVMCDVPCAGLGIIRRKPEIKYKSEESLKDLPNLQYSILENGAKYVKDGGKLIYSTCSLSYAENEAVVHRFLREHEEFEGWQIGAPYDEWATKHCLTLYPHLFGSDGFFIARFQKRQVD